jgi:4-hydroxy-tetrahydrodipicolinate reductase
MTRLHVNGALGRLGRVIVQLAEMSGEFTVTKSGRGDVLGELISGCDVVIDVSQPEASVLVADECGRRAKPVVIGTTGHNAGQREELQRTARRTALLLAPNFSVGVNLLFWLTEQTAKTLGPEFDVEVVEIHHRLKKDAPSGTARQLGEIIAQVHALTYETSVRNGRAGLVGERTPGEIGIQAVRGGEVVGEHTVFFAGLGERLELGHKASSRETFARGALRAARWLLPQSAGMYDMQDVLGLKRVAGPEVKGER